MGASTILESWGYDFSKPNIKKLLIPDPGHVIVDVDLEQADAQVVAWESDCKRLKEIFRDPTKDLHDENTSVVYGYSRDDIPDKLSAKEFTGFRKKTKGGVHGTNYRGQPPTIANALGITVEEAKEFQRVWFEKNPEILEWHNATEHKIITDGYLETKFGFRTYFMGRLSQTVLNEAQAWVPQSTVGSVINAGWMNIEKNINNKILSGVEYWKHGRTNHVKVLMQVHDSLVMQVKKSDLKSLLPDIKTNMLVEIPYEEPLTIGVGNPEISDRSYGEVKPHTWDGELI